MLIGSRSPQRSYLCTFYMRHDASLRVAQKAERLGINVFPVFGPPCSPERCRWLSMPVAPACPWTWKVYLGLVGSRGRRQPCGHWSKKDDEPRQLMPSVAAKSFRQKTHAIRA